MVVRCSPEDRLIDPCGCALSDCLLDVGEAASMQRQIVSELYQAGKIPAEEALRRFKIIQVIEDAGYAECVAENQRCRGAEPLPLKPFTPQQKSQFRTGSKADWRHGVTRWMVRLAVLKQGPTPPTGVIGAASLSIALWGTCILHAAEALEDVANDPIDENFQKVFKPVVIHLPEFVVEDGIDEIQATTLNEWLCTEAKGTSFAQAFVTAINRAQGAEAAENSKARDRQLAAARDFANRWADTLMQAAGLRPMVALVLSNPEIDAFSISQSELWEIQQEIVASGWPNELINAHFKISAEDRSRILRKATSMLNEITGVSAKLIDNFNDPDFTSREREVSVVLKGFAMAQ
jgi:hypothetical protein